ncbi:MAG: anthranilate phosphoribosyltransferase [Alphaproteobacteria bacterium]|nr:anthranilate phosphoribosyltransferase [Alphaproteobacteria bacterium]
MIFADALSLLREGESLSLQETQDVFDALFRGEIEEPDLETLLLGLRKKGETQEELQGAAMAMRRVMDTVQAPEGAMDIVGTGGDGHGSLNVSTATALVVAASAVPVAKHGNRASTSKSGSSDVLAALGYNLEAPKEVVERSMNEIGIGFLFAPRHHPAMKHVAAVRQKIGVRTIFNLLGPLTNPAGVKQHLVGVFAPAWREPMAKTLANLGSERAWVVYGYDGLDELSTTGPNRISELKNGEISSIILSPDEVGLPIVGIEAIKGGSPADNAQALRDLLEGQKGPYREIVLLNAAAALVIAGKVRALEHGLTRAADAIDSGLAKAKLDRLISLSNGG